jgi:CrcB protein
MIKNILLVGLGGGAGSMLRYCCQKWFSSPGASAFPMGTFLVNSIGCLLIGILYGMAVKNNWLSENLRLLLMTGFCGGFTTFSAFTLEGNQLLKEDKAGLFFLYVAGSVVIGLAATYTGIRISK